MKHLFSGTIILAIASATVCHAQQVTTRDTIGGTPLVISMDPNINGVMKNMEESCKIATERREERARDRANDYADNYYKPSTTYTPSTPKNTVKVVPNRALTTAEICRENPRIMGIKIQLVVVKSNEEANEVKAYFRRRFPNLKVEVDASLRPNYKVLAGSYFNKQSASGDLAKIRQYFKSAIPVQYRVFCVEAK